MSLVLVASIGVLLMRGFQLLRARLAGRRGATARDLSELCDCLAAAVAAGEGVEAAMLRYQNHCGLTAYKTLSRINRRTSLGTSVADALAKEAVASHSQALAAIGGVVERARRLGQPMAPALAQLAQELRSQDRVGRARAASRAAPIAGLITALVIAPACVVALGLLALGGALLSAAVQPG